MKGRIIVPLACIFLAAAALLLVGVSRETKTPRRQLMQLDPKTIELKRQSMMDASGKLLLSTLPRDFTEEPGNQLYVKFILKCLAEHVVSSGVHVLLYTADDAVEKHVVQNKMPLQIKRIEKRNEVDFSLFTKMMHSEWPNASGYAFLNGDICPSAEFLKDVKNFFAAKCSTADGNAPTSNARERWRFSTTNRHDVDLTKEELTSLDPLGTLENAVASGRGKPYNNGGVDFFGWNREMFLEHILPTLPNFSMPLKYADNYMYKDAKCNGLVFNPYHAKLYHVNHGKLYKQSGKKFGMRESNFVEIAKVNTTKWKEKRCAYMPTMKNSAHCKQNNNDFLCHAPDPFTCKLDT